MAADALVRCYFEDVWNKGDLVAADSVFAANHMFHDPNHPWISRGAEGVKRFVSAYKNAFPTLRMRIDELLQADGRLVVRWTCEGKHLGKFFHLPPSGKRFAITGLQIHRMGTRMIEESWAQWDMLGLFEQLGAVPHAVVEDTEEAELSYWKTHKLWWQIAERGSDEPHDSL